MTFSRIFHSWCLTAAVAVATAGIFTSCDAIRDDEGDCSVHYRVKFRYDYNFKEADAFASEVTGVSLYLFDPADGHLVWHGTESGSALGVEGWTMPVEVAPGRYDIIAWCHGEHDDASGFAYAGDPSAVTSKNDLIRRMERKTGADGAYSDTDLHGLYHVAVDNVEFPDTYGDVEIPTLHLTKDTNLLRIMLQHVDGSPLEKDDFDITVTDDNGLLGYDNRVIADEIITYHPWSKISGVTTMPDPENRAVTSVSALIAELSTSRLMANHNPTLKVTHKEDDGSVRDVLRLPLIEYLLMVKGNYHRYYSDQQYLDYQDEYTMTFFLDANNKWHTASGIFINSWHVMLQFEDM